MKKTGFLAIAALGLCAAALMAFCGRELSHVLLQMQGSTLFLGL